MKNTGTCPKCSSTEVYTNKNDHPRGERSNMAGPGGKISTRLFIHVYACLECGYFEEYIEPSDLSNEKKMGKLKEDWTKVG